MEQQGLMEKPQQVIRRVWLGELMKVSSVDEQPCVGPDAIQDLLAGERSAPGLSRGANAAGTVRPKPMLTCHPENHKVLKICAKSTLPVFHK